MRFRRSAGTAQEGPSKQPEPRPPGAGHRPRLAKAEREIAALRRRVTALEKELQEARHLNKRLAEITDVVAEVLLPAEDRDEQRLRELLSRYDSHL